MKSAVTALLAGIAVGVMLTIFLGSMAPPAYRQEVAHGVGIGFGAGFGAVLAALVWNKLVGYFDRLASGKAGST